MNNSDIFFPVISLLTVFNRFRQRAVDAFCVFFIVLWILTAC